MRERALTENAMISDFKTCLGSAIFGLAAAALMPGGFRIDAWLFGALVGIGQSLLGIRAYRAALRRSSFAFGFALGSGVLRIAFVLATLAAALAAGCPAAPFAWSILVIYAAMMIAEITVVARAARRHSEAC